MSPIVLVERIADDAKSLLNQTVRAFKVLSLFEDFQGANAIFIKPNLTYPYYKKGVTTRKILVECIITALRQINTITRIYVGE